MEYDLEKKLKKLEDMIDDILGIVKDNQATLEDLKRR